MLFSAFITDREAAAKWIDTHFSVFFNLRTGAQIFNSCLTELVGEKDVNNMGRDSLLRFPDLRFGELWVHNKVQ